MKTLLLALLLSLPAFGKFCITSGVECPASFGAMVVSSGTAVSGTTFTATVTSTGAGHLLYLVVRTANASITLSSTGTNQGPSDNVGSVWYRPSGGGAVASNVCAGSDATAGSVDCAFALSSLAGVTTLTIPLSGTSGAISWIMYEVPYTNGPIGMDLSPSEADDSASSTTQTGILFHLSGTNDIIFQQLAFSTSYSSISGGYTGRAANNLATAYLSNTTVGTAPVWTLGSSGVGAVSAIAFTEFKGVVSGIDPSKWVVFNRAAYPNSNLDCYTPGNMQSLSGFLNVNTRLQTLSCGSIDEPYGSYNYTSAAMATRTFNFLYGTIEFRAKFGGIVGGADPVILMYGSAIQTSYPTGSDNGVTGGVNYANTEIDMVEIINNDPSHMAQAIHVTGHNDTCTPAVSDVTANFHTVNLDWNSGSLVWKTDGAVTCTITAAYVPADPHFLLIVNNAGYLNGSITNGTLPWTQFVDYIKVTANSGTLVNGVSIPSGTQIFLDDFNGNNNGVMQ